MSREQISILNLINKFMKSGLVLLLIVFMAILTSVSCGNDNPAVTNLENSEIPPTTFNYKKGDSYSLDITVYPSNNISTNSPAIIFFFGGGWVSGSINQFLQHARYFAQRGMTSVLVDYRVTQRHNSTPFDSVDDAVDALNFVFKNSDQLKIDKNKVVVSGGSAGGHLALMSSFRVMKENNFNPAALIVFNSVIDTGPGGYGYDIIGANYKDISPIDNVPINPPPVINFQGTADNIISVDDAEDYCQEVKLKNGICELKLYQGLGHGFWNYNRSIEFFKQTILEADLFMIRNNIIDGNPNIEDWIEDN